MKFCLFHSIQLPVPKEQVRYYKEALAQVQHAERLGFDSVWITEHHFSRHGIVSATLSLLAYLAGVTERIRLGTGVAVLPFHNPIQLAEEVATVDLLSDGRLDFGIGRAAFPRIYQGYGLSYAESRDRFGECLEIILRSWTAEKFSFHGKYYQYDDLCVVPKPLQKPHPPIRIGATSADTFELVGRMGYPIFINPSRVATLLDLKPLVSEFHQARKKAGHTGQVDVGLRVPVYVAETAEKAYSEPKDSTMFQMQRLINVIADSIGQEGISAGDDRTAQVQRLQAMSYEDVLANTVIYGTAESVVERLQQLQEELGLTQIIYEVNFGCNVPLEHQIKAVKLINENVVPRFK